MVHNAVTRRTFTVTLGTAGLSMLCGHQFFAQGTSCRWRCRRQTADESTPTTTFCRPSMFASSVAGPSDASRQTVRCRTGTSPASLRVMDENGITAAVASVSAPGIWFNNAGLARRLARSCNDFAAQMAADHPQRFGFFAALPLPDVKASLAELSHAVDTLRCDGASAS